MNAGVACKCVTVAVEDKTANNAHQAQAAMSANQATSNFTIEHVANTTTKDLATAIATTHIVSYAEQHKST